MVPRKKPKALDQIVVPTDFSPEATRAMSFALAIARGRTRVTAVHAIDPFPYRFGPQAASNLKRKQAWALARERMVHLAARRSFLPL
jgi:nucleotide-binding universal stress UspA family protein